MNVNRNYARFLQMFYADTKKKKIEKKNEEEEKNEQTTV